MNKLEQLVAESTGLLGSWCEIRLVVDGETVRRRMFPATPEEFESYLDAGDAAMRPRGHLPDVEGTSAGFIDEDFDDA